MQRVSRVHIMRSAIARVRSSLGRLRGGAPQERRTRQSRPDRALELIDPAISGRFKSLGVIANFPAALGAARCLHRCGHHPLSGRRAQQYLYPARALKDAGALIAGGSDWGVSSFDPFIAMEHGITRSEHKGAPPLLARTGADIAGYGGCVHHQCGVCAQAGEDHGQSRARQARRFDRGGPGPCSRSTPTTCTRPACCSPIWMDGGCMTPSRRPERRAALRGRPTALDGNSMPQWAP